MTFTPRSSPRLHDHFDGFRMRTLHDHYMRCTGLFRQLSFEPTAVHGFQVGHYGNARKLGAKCTNTVHSFGNDEGGPRLQPVDSCTDREPRGFESFGDGR